MKTTKNIARLAVTAGLTAALSFGGVMAPVTMAFAAGTPTVATEPGKVFITDPDTEYATSFKGIQIFTAKITQDKKSDGWDDSVAKTLSDIQWASGNVKTLVTTALKNVKGVPDVNADAQTWAEFINQAQGSNAGKNTAVDNGTVLDLIAAALEGDKTLTWTQPSNSSKGNFENLEHGYWLFVTDAPGKTSGNNGNTDAYTSPIFTIVGGSDVNVTPKKNVPNVTKAVKDDKDGSTFGADVFKNPNKVADSAMDQYVDYQLTGTVASNINTYSTYKYIFTDELPKSMTPRFTDKAGSMSPAVTVKIDNKKVISGYTATLDENNVLKVDFTDLKTCKGENNFAITVTGNSTVTVEYQAKLDSDKIFETNGSIKTVFDGLIGKGQENKVKLTYSNNPHAEGTGDTVVHPAYDYTYGIDVTKVGSDTVDGKNPPLSGVKFTLQEKNGDTIENKYIDAKGVKHAENEVVELTTDDGGKISVVGLDEGTYILKEVTPAPGYNNSAKDGVTFTIKRDSNDQLYQAGQSVTPSTDSVIDAASGVVKEGTASASTGKLSFTIVDKKGSNLPLTGLNGVTFTWIAGGAVLCIGVAHLIRSRKRDEGSEE